MSHIRLLSNIYSLEAKKHKAPRQLSLSATYPFGYDPSQSR